MPRPLLATLLCLPSLAFILYNRDVPHFGILEDDGIYLIGAKSIAETGSYRVLNLPTEPPQTKYPPLYPLYLSLAWKLAPALPQKISAAMLTSWIALPLTVVLFHLWLVRRKFQPRAAWIITGLFALNPYVLFFTSNLGSELFFIVWLFLAIRSAERGDAAISGLYAGLGFLARTAGVALLPAAIVYYLIARQPRKAAVFTLAMLPAILGWTLWSRAHTSSAHDLVTLYYTNYLRYQFLNVGLDNIGVVLWKNFSALLESCGSYVFPQMIAGLPAKLILQPLALAMILGVVRIARDRAASLYPIFGAFSAAMLLVWHFAPNQRFVLPLVPLLLAGFWKEAEHFSGLVRTAFRHKDRSQRIVAYGFAGFLIAILATGAALQVYMWINVIPGQARDDRANAAEYASVYRWIVQNTPPDAKILWENDTNLYLSTGRHAVAFLIPTRQWYRSENDEDLASYRQIDQYARAQGLEYIVLPESGPHRNEDVLKSAEQNVSLEKLHEETGGIVYKLKK
ncbi:MAG: hypothetical protein LAO79_01820 [Acidobacteriia bacterium]|nr:hypothetical protein [Terriglobia bacterium]